MSRSNNALLLALGNALRAQKLRRRRYRRRAVAMALGGAILIGTALSPPTPRLVWNTSASAPIGLYSVSPNAFVEPGDMVVARIPEAYRALAARRRYLPAGVPLVKRAVAAAGDEVCAFGANLFVNGRRIAERRMSDGQGRDMPIWWGCQRLRGRQLFLLMDAPASFDGRYFGVSEGADVLGKARLLWAR